MLEPVISSIPLRPFDSSLVWDRVFGQVCILLFLPSWSTRYGHASVSKHMQVRRWKRSHQAISLRACPRLDCALRCLRDVRSKLVVGCDVCAVGMLIFCGRFFGRVRLHFLATVHALFQQYIFCAWEIATLHALFLSWLFAHLA